MLEIYRAGGPVMPLLLACSIVAVAVILERALVWWWPPGQRQRVVERVLAAAGRDARAATRRMELAARAELERFGRRLGVLDTLVSLAPLLGILGTVLGIMESFQILDPAAPAAPAAARQGLAKALVTTAFGLTIAMVSLIALKVFQAQSARLRHELESRCTEREIDLGVEPEAELAEGGA